MLFKGPASGYDLLKRFEVSLANVWSATQSQLYGELVKMADDKLVTVSAEGPRGRKEYEITSDGRAELLHWMTEVEPEPPRRSPILLRVFFLHLLEPPQAQAFLQRQAALAAERHNDLAKLKDLVDNDDDPESRTGRLALEWGLRFSALTRDWATWAETQLKPR
jgi:DNA-binding PadR family transcriptional regulator